MHHRALIVAQGVTKNQRCSGVLLPPVSSHDTAT
tara:strand:- start:812 stop:913 length:102 start_codon:yes stop_codon:yes gene_type:complete